MGWEMHDGRFFCNTSDEFFGPELDCSVWPDTDQYFPSAKCDLFWKSFLQFCPDDPRRMTNRKLSKICGEFEEKWNEVEISIEKIEKFVDEFGLSRPWDSQILFWDLLNKEKPKPKTVKKKKKTAKKKAKKKTAKKKTSPAKKRVRQVTKPKTKRK